MSNARDPESNSVNSSSLLCTCEKINIKSKPRRKRQSFQCDYCSEKVQNAIIKGYMN